MRVAELFGPTIQGEGPSAGQRCVFARLSGCNLDCAWCDTPYTWDWTRYDPTVEARRMDCDDVIADLRRLAGPGPEPLLVITGGEPLTQAAACVDLAAHWAGRVEVETNGTRPVPPGLNADVNVSPKLRSSGVDRRKAWPTDDVHATYRDHDGRVAYKFVVADLDDAAEVAQYVEHYDLAPSSVWLMPEGRDARTLVLRARWVTDLAVGYGYNVSTRLHVLAWEDRRAV